MKKILSMLLILCFLLTALMACGEDPEATEGGTEAGSESATGPVEQGGTLASTNEYEDNEFIPAINPDEHDYDQETINILSRATVQHYREWGKEEIGDDILDQAIKARNDIVASDLNVVVNIIRKETGSFNDYLEKFNSYIKNDVDLGLHEYDIVSAFAYGAPNAQIRDYLANMANTDVFPYFDFTKPCWNQTLVKNITINNKLYCAASDINLSIFDKTMVMWCNKTLYNELKEDDDPDIQDLALSKNGWTYTDLYAWSQRYEDRPNTTADCEDFYGYCMAGGTYYDVYVPGWDIQLINTANDGTHTFNIIGNSHAEECLEAIRDIMKQQGTLSKCTCGKSCCDHFVGGTVLFWQDVLFGNDETNLKIREMDAEFCILPVPKYSETQPNYGTTPADNYNLITIIDHYESDVPTKGEAISAYLQHASEQSYKEVRGMYFRKIVEGKYFGVNDETGTVTKSQKLFRIILDAIEFDIGIIYSPILRDLGWLWRDNVNKQTTLEDAFTSNNNSYTGDLRTRDQYEQCLRDFDTWIFS